MTQVMAIAVLLVSPSNDAGEQPPDASAAAAIKVRMASRRSIDSSHASGFGTNAVCQLPDRDTSLTIKV